VKDPATGQWTTKWTQNQALSRDQQRIFDSQTQRNADLASMAQSKSSQVKKDMATPLNWKQFGNVIDGPKATTGNEEFSWDSQNRQRAEDAAYGRATQRLDPQYEKELATLERQMAGRGLRAGDSAYDSAMGNFYNGKNDAYEMARMGATGEGRMEDQQSYGQAQGAFGLNRQAEQQQFSQQAQAADTANALRQQEISEYLSKRGQSLSEANALSGSMNTAEMSNTYGGSSE